jgi:hypothetical protein
MKIAAIETIPLRIPFTTGGPAYGFGGKSWTTLDMTLVRVETEDGLVGWGDAFSYGCQMAVKAALDDMLIPLMVGQDATDIVVLNHELQQKLHLFGRYGITIFAISGIDIHKPSTDRAEKAISRHSICISSRREPLERKERYREADIPCLRGLFLCLIRHDDSVELAFMKFEKSLGGNANAPIV